MDDVDLLVIGGGINGAGIARDASGRGLRVLLCEQHDLAAHTSSASSKLIHGGLRYLEQGEFGLVRKALGEREVVRRQAPSGPSAALRPAVGTAPAPALDAARGAVAVRPSGPAQPRLPASRALELQHDPLGQWLSRRCGRPSATPMRRSMTRGWYCSTPWMPRSGAHRCRCAAAASTCTPCRAGGRPFWNPPMASGTVNARAVVNAAGPWAGGLLERMQARSGGPALRLVQGSHIVLRRPWPDDSACLLQQPDGRVVFLLPSPTTTCWWAPPIPTIAVTRRAAACCLPR
jgi:glycerol-3-phosphate dehydrogenase